MQIDFYILETANKMKAWLYACQLLENLALDQQQVYVNLNSQEEAEQMDVLLWTYREDSFLPHCLYPRPEPQPSLPLPSIQIGCAQTPPQQDVLLNLAERIPPGFAHYRRTVEIVFADSGVQQAARERYKWYRDQSHPIQTYKLKAHEL